MTLTTGKEAAISIGDGTLRLLEEWAKTVRTEDLSAGLSVNESLAQALKARQMIEARGSFPTDESSGTPDVLHALCRVLMADCLQAPGVVLRDARLIREALGSQPWEFDELSEREGLLGSLTLICWRANRLLNLTREVQRSLSEYMTYFRNSVDWGVSHREWGELERWRRLRPADLEILDPEVIFRILLQLQEDLESDPESIAFKSRTLYNCLSSATMFPPDLHSFFQADSARLIGVALRVAGQHRDAIDWLDKAESHARAGVNPAPQLARILFVRLTISYASTQLEPVLKAAPFLDKTFTRFGMDEDRIKCGILWAASLKVAGQPETALDVLENLRRSMSSISSQLSGWVLAEIGDIHGICGDHQRAIEALEMAARMLRRERQLTGLAHVNSMLGCICRSQGLFQEAVRIFTKSIRDFKRLGMATSAAYTRLLLAETFLAMQLPRNAEREVLRALPIFEDEGIVSDALVALSILREAVRRRKLDPQMLRELRERLRPGTR
jgi:tetratricopeptide (TPR) repeat protein